MNDSYRRRPGARLTPPKARLLVIAVAAMVTLIGLDDAATPASSYQGFGASTPGGAGGAIIRVTTLADSGPGSLRAALCGGGNRTIVFDVGGPIELTSAVYVNGAFITIDGFTAPPPGITLRAGPSSSAATWGPMTHRARHPGPRYPSRRYPDRERSLQRGH